MRKRVRWAACTAYRQERRYILEVLGQIENEHIRTRAYDLLLWYIRSANRCRLCYYLFRTITIVLPALIMVITSSGSGLAIWADELWGSAANFLVAALSGLTGLASGLLALTRCEDNYLRYRRAADQIKGELSRYLVGAGIYRESATRDQHFITALEIIAAREGESWGRDFQQNGLGKQAAGKEQA